MNFSQSDYLDVWIMNRQDRFLSLEANLDVMVYSLLCRSTSSLEMLWFLFVDVNEWRVAIIMQILLLDNVLTTSVVVRSIGLSADQLLWWIFCDRLLLHQLINIYVLSSWIGKSSSPYIKELLGTSSQEIVSMSAEDSLGGMGVQSIGKTAFFKIPDFRLAILRCA